MTENLRIGVLALQGDVREHLAALRSAGAEASRVRRSSELDAVDALVIPGGESTTIGKLLVTFDLLEPLQKRVRDGMPCFGSCAGMILLADRVLDGTADQVEVGGLDGTSDRVEVGGLDVTVRRNAFGRQVDSFEESLSVAGLEDGGPFHAVFIRAPWVESVGADVVALATIRDGAAAGKVVAVRQGSLLATSFHPELSGDARIHRLFVDIARGAA